VVLRSVRRNNYNDLDEFIKHEFYEYDYRAIQHHLDGARDNDNSAVDHDYNGGRKGYYDPSRNHDYLFFNDDDSGSTASPAASASAANND